MKFGVICYKRPIRPNSGININIGDPIQELAVLNLYKEMRIPKDDIIFIDRYHMGSYNGEPVILPMCSFNQISNMYGYNYDSLPPSDKILPVYISFHLHTRVLSEELCNHLKKHEPIGCRDEETKINLENHGIKAYITGCITATFPLRNKSITQTKTYFIDTPDSLENFIPSKLKSSGKYIGHMPSFSRLSSEHYLTDEEMLYILNTAKDRLAEYANEASLVVTSRLHAASPCMAMGIPTIIVRDNIDGRFSWIDKFLPIYTHENFHTINWKPNSISYESHKDIVKKFYKAKIIDKYNNKINNNTMDLFVSRNKYDYNSKIVSLLKKEFEKNNIDDQATYVVWGICPTTEVVVNTISDVWPNMVCEMAIDSYVEGEFYGRKIHKPNAIQKTNPNYIYIVIPKSAFEDAKSLFEEVPRKYILFNLKK